MDGKLEKQANGRWAIVDDFDGRVEITSGDVIEVYSYSAREWERTRVEHGRDGYYACTGVILYSGLPARYIGR